MSQSRTLFIGMDVHKESIAVASVAQAHGAEVPSLGALGTRQCAIDHLLRQRPSQATQLVFVYAAGPCGSWLSRSRTKKDSACWVVAPSLRPKKAGDRVTTDRRDAVQLARLARSGALTPGSVPTGEAAALRALPRAREETLGALKAATFRLQAFLLRHDIRSTGRANWSPAPLRWLSAVVCPTPAQHLVLQEDVRAVTAHTARLQRLEQALQEHVTAWRLPPVGEARQALRGGQCTVAVTTVAERGDLTRFATPRARRKCLGRIPSEYSTGERRRQGAIPTAGNPPARRALGDGAWAYRSPAQVRRPRQLRLDKHPKALQDISWTAPVRRCKRYRTLIARGQHANQVVVALARELIGCMGAIAKAVPVTPYAPLWDDQRLSTQQGSHRASAETPPRFWCHPRRREEPPRAYSGRA